MGMCKCYTNFWVNVEAKRGQHEALRFLTTVWVVRPQEALRTLTTILAEVTFDTELFATEIVV